MSKFAGDEKSFIILLSIFVGSITIASVLANKIINVFGLFVPAGVLAYSITFLMTDAISEIWGKKAAKRAVLGGFIGLIVVLLLIQVSLVWPKAPFWKQEPAYQTIMGVTSRIIVASFITAASAINFGKLYFCESSNSAPSDTPAVSELPIAT